MSINVDLGGHCIKTTIAIYPKEVDECIQALMSNSRNHKKLIGLDIIPCRNSSRKASVALLQLCDEKQCVIFRFSHFCTVPESLYNFLSLPAYTFVGFGIKHALALLVENYGFVCKNSFEVSHSGTRRSVGSMCPVFRTLHVPPTHCISDFWDAKYNLTEDLLKLAVSNAHAAFNIGYAVFN